jgi:hypothetical protein
VSDELFKLIKSGKNEVYRKAFIKRRNVTDGLFETDWFEITEDVKKWGKIKTDTDSTRPGRFRFSGAKLTVANDEGKYNEGDDTNSLWKGFLDRQRTLFKIETGFVKATKTASLIWDRRLIPGTVGS